MRLFRRDPQIRRVRQEGRFVSRVWAGKVRERDVYSACCSPTRHIGLADSRRVDLYYRTRELMKAERRRIAVLAVEEQERQEWIEEQRRIAAETIPTPTEPETPDEPDEPDVPEVPISEEELVDA